MSPQKIDASPIARLPFAGLISALQNSLRGLMHVARSERAIRQEMLAVAVGIPSAMMISEQCWTRISLCGVLLLVIIVELVNTAIEKICDHVTPTQHPDIGLVKDIGSAAVLGALILALIVWGNALLCLFS